MSASAPPFRGRVEAAGFVLDPAHVGVAEVRRRVVAAWVPGARLLDLDGRVLLLLPAPVSIRAEQAPGLPVLPGPPLRVRDHGQGRSIDPDRLGLLDPGASVDLGSVEVRLLAPAPGERVVVPPVERVDRAARPELRADAGLAGADTPLGRRGRRLAAESAGPRRSRRRRGGTLARLVSRSPAGAVLGRRHRRYLDELTRTFQQRDWDNALRSAIAVGGQGTGALSLRLPRSRGRVLGPGARPTTASSSVPMGPTVHDHLAQLYRRSATQLEQEGKHLLAAFVLADLLHQPVAAVELLERHGQVRKAAELAEGWELAPELVVRLWWRAGERDRAVALAGARSVFAEAVVRLEKLDPDAATGLRRAWVDERRAAGDPAGAVAAGWPSRELRDGLTGDLAAGIARGGTAAGVLLAHLLEHAPGDAALDAARALFDDDPELRAARTGFVETLTETPLPVASHDRELASRALVAASVGDLAAGDETVTRVLRVLQARADPLLAADLPPLSARRKAAAGREHAGTPLEVDARDEGQLTVHDAVAVGERSLLVALGELGVRLLGADGRVRAEWSVPAHRIVVADHGGRVLLLAERDTSYAVHELDLPGGRPVALPGLEDYPLDGYDGARPVVASATGIEWLQRHGDHWRVVWRELTEPGQQIWKLVRDHEHLAAIHGSGPVECWHWDLPSVRLRGRRQIDADGDLVVVATGEIGRVQQANGVATLDWFAATGNRISTDPRLAEGPCSVLVAGSAFALAEERADELRLDVHARPADPVGAVVRLARGSRPILRSWGDLVTVGSPGGRVVVVDLSRRRLVADVRVRA